ncbi:MAG: E3 ubiquitin ligase family protein [Desulfobacterales bacterium]|nr:E3 ubiquitin ligase family protein [Desulfobacterales bacterium]
MIFLGIVLICISGGLAVGYVFKKKKLMLIESTETSTVEFLQSLAQSMKDGVGENSLHYFTEVKGNVICNDPLTSEIAQTKCVYYSMSIDRQYEEVYYERDQQGKQHKRTRSAYETVATNTRKVPFEVEDSTGKISINPEGAELISEKIISRFEPAKSHSNNMLRIGNMSFNLNVPMFTGDRKTLGYRIEEHAILTGKNIYVLGDATDQYGQLCIQRPTEKNKKFIISVKGEEELLREEKLHSMLMLIFGILCAIGGIGVLVYQVVLLK